jgi:cell division protein ZapA
MTCIAPTGRSRNCFSSPRSSMKRRAKCRAGPRFASFYFAALMLADDAQEAKGKVEKAEPQSDSLRAAVALAESREAAARDELRGALAREQAALKELEAARQAVPAAAPPPAKPSNDRALLQIADRIEALATKVEQIP